MDEKGRPQGSGPPGQRQTDGGSPDGTPGPILHPVMAEDPTYRVIFQRTSLGFCRTDPAGILQEVNPALSRMLGCAPERLIGTSIGRFTHPDHVACDRALRQAMARGEIDQVHTDTRWLRQDGKGFWVNLTVRPVKDAAGVVRFHFATVESIAGRKQRQAELTRILRERETTWLQSIMHIVKDGIHILDQTGRLVVANPAFLDSLGYTVEESQGLRVQDWDTVLDPAALAGWIQTTIQGPRLFETRHRRKDGRVFDVEVNAGGVELDGRMYLLASSRDITARKACERELGLRQAQLEERITAAIADLRQKDQILFTQNRQAAMGEMIGHISHQWRQPLNALSMLLINLGEAHRCGGLTPEKLERSLAKGDLLIQKMSSTINDFRDFFKPGKALAAFSALEQIRAAVALAEACFEAAHVAIRIEAAADVLLLGFPNEYSQVLLNLLSNAKQAIQEVPGRSGLVSIQLAEEDGWGSLTVRDNGCGIAEAVLPRIFEPFFSTRPSGTGIGLYLSRQIIEGKMGGRICARNVEGGAAFSVRVPIAGKRL
jgi:PAS domain S-box-containing protein